MILAVVTATALGSDLLRSESLPKIEVDQPHRSFQRDGQPFVPLGVTYFRPGTGWAPQLWRQFDAEATRADFARLKEAGVNCVRVFISYGSFLTQPDALDPEGLARFDQFLAMAEAAGIYVHPTGPDHWEGTPNWAKGDRIADEQVLRALEKFWTLFAARYRERHVLFAYDLRNEPEVAWDTAALREKWNRWLLAKYGDASRVAQAWAVTNREADAFAPPPPKDNLRNRELLDYQSFREDVAEEWTRRQVAAIKAADPAALVTVGLIQWSVPAMTPGISHYAAFRPERQARHLDFMEVHFYPLEHGFYEYSNPEAERRNLAYLESVVREVARPGKPVVIGEFGWYGGGKLSIDGGKHPAASEDQQARWCRQVIESTRGLATGWLNWGFFDHPEARDVSQLTGLLTADGRLKAWGQEFRRLAGELRGPGRGASDLSMRPALDWEACLTSAAEANRFREEYYRAFEKN